MTANKGAYQAWRQRRRDRAYRRRFGPCDCGCGRILRWARGWDGYHGAGPWTPASGDYESTEKSEL